MGLMAKFQETVACTIFNKQQEGGRYSLISTLEGRDIVEIRFKSDHSTKEGDDFLPIFLMFYAKVCAFPIKKIVI